MKKTFLLLTVLSLAHVAHAANTAHGANTAQRVLMPDDVYALKSVGDPRLSPDGRLVAYTVKAYQRKEDGADTDVYMVPLAGGEPLRLTASPKPETSPRWSPDGRYLAFLSGREGKKTQVWLLPRVGGEAVQLTHYPADVQNLAWSPDGKRLALVVGDRDPDDPDAPDAANGASTTDVVGGAIVKAKVFVAALVLPTNTTECEPFSRPRRHREIVSNSPGAARGRCRQRLRRRVQGDPH